MFRKDREPEQALADGTPVEVCDRIIASVRGKANNNERRARNGVLLVAASTALIPFSLVLSVNWAPFLLGKVIPAALAALAALVSTWLHTERPHERWQLYRGYQRAFEVERLRFKNSVGTYS